MTRGKLLDVAAGDGPLSDAAAELGYEVTACDLQPERFKAPGLTCVRCDLDDRLPFEDASFDYLTCVEAIEHLHNRFSFLRECARVLKPGGKLLLTTPNVLNLSARMRYLVSGFLPLFSRPLNEFDEGSLHGHVSPLPYQMLHHALGIIGFRVAKVTTDRYRRSAMLWAGLWLNMVIAHWWVLRKEKHPEQREVTRRVLRDMRSASLLFGRTTIIVADWRTLPPAP